MIRSSRCNEPPQRIGAAAGGGVRAARGARGGGRQRRACFSHHTLVRPYPFWLQEEETELLAAHAADVAAAGSAARAFARNSFLVLSALEDLGAARQKNFVPPLVRRQDLDKLLFIWLKGNPGAAGWAAVLGALAPRDALRGTFFVRPPHPCRRRTHACWDTMPRQCPLALYAHTHCLLYTSPSPRD